MGHPKLNESGSLEQVVVDFDGENLSLDYTYVNMGNPHCVIFVDDLENYPVKEIGSQIEWNKALFPNRYLQSAVYIGQLY